MKQIIKKLFCCHEWQEKSRYEHYDAIKFFYNQKPIADYVNIFYVCKKCGKTKTITL